MRGLESRSTRLPRTQKQELRSRSDAHSRTDTHQLTR
jgi:hypothetical protein